MTTAKLPQKRANGRKTVPREPIARQVGGHLALDFSNTAGEHLSEQPGELLRDWDSFVRWLVQVSLIEPESYFELLKYPEPLAPIIEFREAIYRAGLAIAGKRKLLDRDLDVIRERAAGSKPEIEIRHSSVHWKPSPSHVRKQICAVIAGDSLSLFCSPLAERIRVCEGGLCGWLFIDDSRGQRRRWCDMNDCGSRAKARRYYQKHKES